MGRCKLSAFLKEIEDKIKFRIPSVCKVGPISNQKPVKEFFEGLNYYLDANNFSSSHKNDLSLLTGRAFLSIGPTAETSQFFEEDLMIQSINPYFDS